MASIVSSLRAEDEVKLQECFSRRVCFHLLYKSSHHGAGVDQLLKKFDLHGKYLLTVFLKTGLIKGAFMSESLGHGKRFSDNEAFVFTKERYYIERFPSKSQRTTVVPVSVSTDSISFGKGLNLELYDGSWYVSFSRDVFTGERKSESDVCIDVELHRVQDVNDILPEPWRDVDWQESLHVSLV